MVAQPKMEGKLTKLFSPRDDSPKVASTRLAPRGNSKAALSHTLTPDRPQRRKRNGNALPSQAKMVYEY
jgi:hypothetical protein